MNIDQEISAFIQKNGVTKLSLSAKTISGRQMSRAIRGYEYKTIEQEMQEKTEKNNKKKPRKVRG